MSLRWPRAISKSAWPVFCPENNVIRSTQRSRRPVEAIHLAGRCHGSK
jgi:hypothetical protein